MLRYLKNYINSVSYIYGERNWGHGITEQTKINLNEDRYEERLERSRENIEKIKNADLLILIDSSSNDVETCRVISENGIDIVILDHHEIEAENPYVIMVNPQQEGCEYPNKFLSGAGVVFKTLQVMEDTLGEVDVWQYIDLVAVGMYADVMRIDVLENRYLIMNGLRNIKNTGLVRILKGAKADLFKLNGDSIGFIISPLLNGVAREGNLKLAIDILLEDDDSICKKLRLKMVKLNDERKEKQKEIIEKYSKSIDCSKKILIVTDEQSSRGYNGIIAQQLAEKYKRPAIVGRLHNNCLSGSFRSYGGFDLKQFLNDSCLVEEALGHAQAGGISVKEENINDLVNYIEYNLPELRDKELTVVYDFEINVNEVENYIRIVEQFNLLTGNGFPKILTKVNNITVENVETIGSTQETRKIKTFDNVELIKFKVNENYASDLSVFSEIDVIGTIEMNEWYNFKLKQKICKPQIKLSDYRVI